MTKRSNEDRIRTILTNLFRDDERAINEELYQEAIRAVWYVQNDGKDPPADSNGDSLATQTLVLLSQTIKQNVKNARARRAMQKAMATAAAEADEIRWDKPQSQPSSPRRKPKATKATK